jgi:hypothetical protein
MITKEVFTVLLRYPSLLPDDNCEGSCCAMDLFLCLALPPYKPYQHFYAAAIGKLAAKSFTKVFFVQKWEV